MFSCLALLAVACGSAGSAAGEESDRVLVDLGDAGTAATWTTLNDPVMGGKSTSRAEFGNGGLVFSGDVSLENNGGFASARGPVDAVTAQRTSGATSLRVRAVGDGKTYMLKLGTAGQPWSYIQRFPTVAGVERDYELPVRQFEPVGQRLKPAPDAPHTLDPALINQVAVYILDEQPGPFEITVREIDAL